MHTCDNIFFHKYLLCIFVLHEDSPCRSKHVGIIIIKKEIFMHEYFIIILNKYIVINLLHGTGTKLILICAMWGGMCQDGVMA